MSVIVIDPSARNLPEQVLKNSQDINDLQTAIEELTKVLPDIMGKSPATYVAAIALDSEAKPAGQYHLLFANTSYDVKNGDYVFCVFVHAASGSSYVGVLQVVNDTYASGQYAATVTAVTPNLRGNDGATGPQGPQGIQGPTGETGDKGDSGLNALECDSFRRNGEPVNNSKLNVMYVLMNRTPIVGDKFVALCVDNITQLTYLVNFTVESLNAEESYCSCNIDSYSQITGPAGKDGIGIDTLSELGNAFNNATPPIVTQNNMGFVSTLISKAVYSGGQKQYNQISIIPIKATNGIIADVSEDGNFIELHAELYRHHIEFTGANGMSFNFDIYNRSATAFTYDTLVSYLSTKKYPISGGESVTSTKVTAYIGVLDSKLLVTYADQTLYTIEKANTSMSDTVEEI